MLLPNYRMKLTRLGRRFAQGRLTLPCPGWLAETRLGLQLMRGRYPAPEVVASRLSPGPAP